MSGFVSFAEYHIENTDFDFLEKYWDYDKNNLDPYKLRVCSGKKVWIKCQNTNYHGSYEIACNHFKSGRRCPYCSKKGGKCHEKDSLGYLYPFISELIVCDENGEDVNTFKLSPHSDKKFFIKCKYCNKVHDKSISLNHLTNRGFNCMYCGCKKSMGEKMVNSILTFLKIKFKHNIKFEWSNNKEYDFYIPDLDMIIETHGIQHYKDTNRGRTLKEEQENDKYKKQIALTNGIKQYITIDCRKTDLNWIKNNIVDELSLVMDLSKVDWNHVFYNSLNNNMLKCHQLKNEGKTIKEISTELNVCVNTVRNYLNIAKDIWK